MLNGRSGYGSKIATKVAAENRFSSGKRRDVVTGVDTCCVAAVVLIKK